MLSREAAIKDIFNNHGFTAIYIVSTGFISRAVYNLYPKNNVFYMKGSMGLAPAIGLGLALSTDKIIVVIHGDGSHLMHLGLTHTIRDANLKNLFIYILNNGSYESVGGQPCSHLEENYLYVNSIYEISCDGKPSSRVAIGFEENAKKIMQVLKC